MRGSDSTSGENCDKLNLVTRRFSETLLYFNKPQRTRDGLAVKYFPKQ